MKLLWIALVLVTSSHAQILHGIRLDWLESNPGTSFKIYRSTTPGAETFYASVGVGTHTYRDSRVTNKTRYCYVITAVLAGIESTPSPETCAMFIPQVLLASSTSTTGGLGTGSMP